MVEKENEETEEETPLEILNEENAQLEIELIKRETAKRDALRAKIKLGGESEAGTPIIPAEPNMTEKSAKFFAGTEIEKAIRKHGKK